MNRYKNETDPITIKTGRINGDVIQRMVKIVLYMIPICICLVKYHSSRRVGLLYLVSVFSLQMVSEYLKMAYECGNMIGIALWIIPTAIVLFVKSKKGRNDR